MGSSSEKETHFAAIIPENIALLYLKRSLVEELVNRPESSERKLIGCCVRMISNPKDLSQNNSHQLHPVTGVQRIPGKGNVPERVRLRVSNMINYIPICILSNDDFSKEECEDLCQRVNDGLLKRPTVADVKQKARLLHEDLTKHLQGSTKNKLLDEVPNVTADKIDPHATSQERIKGTQQSNILMITDHTDVLLSHSSVDSGTNDTLPCHGSNASGNVTNELTLTTEIVTLSDDDSSPKLSRQNGKSKINKPIGDIQVERKKGNMGVSNKREKTGIHTRSPPIHLLNAIKSMNDAQKKAVIDMGFEGILELSFDKIPSEMGFWVVDSFDEKTCKLIMQNESIEITKKDVHNMLGIPIGGFRIDTKKVRKTDGVTQEWKAQFGKKKRINPTDVVKKLGCIEDAGRMFKLHFLVLFATVMGEKPIGGECNSNILPSIENDEVIKNLDWCGYILDCLKTSKAGWNKEEKKPIYCGPLTLLTLFYVDSTKCQSMQVSRKRPAIRGWTMKLLRDREKAELKLGGFGKGAIEPPLEVEGFEDDGTEIPERDITPKKCGQAYIPKDKEVDDGDYVYLEDLETVQTQELQYNGCSSEESHAELDSEKSDTSEDENNAAKVNNLQGYIVDLASMIKKIKDKKTALEETLRQAFDGFPNSVELQNLKGQVEALFRQSTNEHQETIIITDSEDDTDPFYKNVY